MSGSGERDSYKPSTQAKPGVGSQPTPLPPPRFAAREGQFARRMSDEARRAAAPAPLPPQQWFIYKRKNSVRVTKQHNRVVDRSLPLRGRLPRSYPLAATAENTTSQSDNRWRSRRPSLSFSPGATPRAQSLHSPRTTALSPVSMNETSQQFWRFQLSPSNICSDFCQSEPLLISYESSVVACSLSNVTSRFSSSLFCNLVSV